MSDLGEEFKKHFENNPIQKTMEEVAEAARIEGILDIVLKNQTNTSLRVKIASALALIYGITEEIKNEPLKNSEMGEFYLITAEQINKLSVILMEKGMEKWNNKKK